MSRVPTGSELIRPFLPCTDRAASTRFYEALGLQKLVDGDDVAIFASGSGGFLLTDSPHENLAGMLMTQLMVDDLDASWAHIEGLHLPAPFGVPAPRAAAVGLADRIWVDQNGILWHVAQRREGVLQD